MKKIFFTFLYFYSTTSLLFAQKGYFNCEVVTDTPMYSFPVLKMNSDNNTALKINTLLQLTELNKIILPSDKNIFNQVYDTDDSIPFGETWLDFEILNNTSTVFSVAINVEWCGASCGHWTNYYNFNSGNGDIISMYDLIDSSEIFIASESIIEKRTQHFINELNNMVEGETVDTTSVLNEMNSNNLNYFYIRNDSVFFDDEHCLSKAEKYYTLDMITSFSSGELKNYLNYYGQSVLSGIKNDVSKFQGKGFPQLYKGITNDSAEFYFTFSFANDQNGGGLIVFDKDGISHSFDGTLVNNHFDLTCHDNDYNDSGFINAVIFKNKITGIYKSVDGKTNYSFVAIRQ